MANQKTIQVVALARRRFLQRLEKGPATFTESIRGLKLPEGMDGRIFGSLVRSLHEDRIIRAVGFAPSSNTNRHSRLWELADQSKGGGR